MPLQFIDREIWWVLILLIATIAGCIIKYRLDLKARPFKSHSTEVLRELLHNSLGARRFLEIDRTKREIELETEMLRRLSEETRTKTLQDRTLEEVLYKGIDAKNSEIAELDNFIKKIRAERSIRARVVSSRTAIHNNG